MGICSRSFSLSLREGGMQFDKRMHAHECHFSSRHSFHFGRTMLRFSPIENFASGLFDFLRIPLIRRRGFHLCQ
ncbi:hypothetical protein WK22_10805 [Burkholderia multivorans]|nr:hypothetical protein WK22_10805 [Burkholderia multivorans]